MKQHKKKLLIVTDYFYPHWTGIAKSLSSFITLIQKDFETAVLTIRYDEHLEKEEMWESTKIMREPYLFSVSRAKYSLHLLGKFLLLVGDTDYILVNSPCTNIMPIAVICRLFQKKLFIYHQGDLILPKGFHNKCIEIIFDISSYIGFSLADKITTNTTDYAKSSRTMRFHLHKFTPLIIPTNKKNKKKKTVPVLEEQKRIGRLLFGFGGRFVEEKGFDILFDAIPKVLPKLPNAHFVFAGDVNVHYEDFFAVNQEKLKKIKNHVSFLGLLSEEELNSFYDSIDFIVIPSRSDCFPVVQIEAVLAKKPAIVSDIPGARVVVEKTGFGLLFQKENSSDLAEKLIHAYKTKKMLLRNYGNVVQFFDTKNHAKAARRFIEK